MMKTLIFAVLAVIPAIASAEQARVIQVSSVVEQFQQTRQRCVIETVKPVEQGSGGAIIGAIVGGVVGNQIGKGSGKDIATGVGVIGGAIAGNEIQNGEKTQQRCTPYIETQSRVVGYNVTFEFGGKQYTQQMSYNPGSYVTVSVIAR
jgi:uncharacterized protein YcfJ